MPTIRKITREEIEATGRIPRPRRYCRGADDPLTRQMRDAGVSGAAGRYILAHPNMAPGRVAEHLCLSELTIRGYRWRLIRAGLLTPQPRGVRNPWDSV